MIGRRGLFWLLAFALVGAQALDLMHRVVHGPQVAIGHEFAAQHQLQRQDGGHGHQVAHGWLGALFSGHDDDSTCRLFDPLGHDAAPAVAAVAMPVILSSFFLQWFQGEALVRWAALFDARGPPSLR